MTIKKRGLGRGLEALLVDVSTKTERHQLLTLPVESLQKNYYLAPEELNSDELQELTNTIKMPDQFEPVVVRKIAGNSYEIVAGENRWRAARLAGLKEVPVIVREIDDKEAMAIALIDTVQKENLNLLQEANDLKKLIDEFEAMIRQLMN